MTSNIYFVMKVYLQAIPWILITVLIVTTRFIRIHYFLENHTKTGASVLLFRSERATYIYIIEAFWQVVCFSFEIGHHFRS